MPELTQWIGIGAGICTAVSLVPQLYRIIKTRKAETIAYGMLAVLVCGLSGWIWYGIRKNDWPIIITNAFATIINIATFYFSIKYKENRQADPK